MQFFDGGLEDYIRITISDRQSCITISRFQVPVDRFVLMPSWLNEKTVAEKIWEEVKHIDHLVDKHVSSHANSTDIRLLLDLKNMWYDADKRYVSQIIEKLSSCHVTAPPQPS